MFIQTNKLKSISTIINYIPIISSLPKSFKNFFVHNVFSCVRDISIFIQYKYFQSFFGFYFRNNNIYGRYNPTLESVWPWLLLIVIAKHKDIGICLLWNLKGNLESDGTKSMLGIKILSPMFFPIITSAKITFLPKWLTCNLVPLQRPFAWSIFLKSIKRRILPFLKELLSWYPHIQELVHHWVILTKFHVLWPCLLYYTTTHQQ